jgi:CheY-like chemotaxis protein
MKTKVLVIDDYLPSGQTLKWVMESAGHEVRLATNGVTALSKIVDFVPDVVLCDINMPKLDGYETCKRMKQDARLKDTLFIAQTGLSSANSKRLSAKAGFKHHLIKPVDVNLLLELVFMEKSALVDSK